jgi:hypothetical protein
MKLFTGRKKEAKCLSPQAVQIRSRDRHPFGALNGYVPLRNGEFALYRTIREAIPIVDAAILKLIRLAGGVSVQCDDCAAQRSMEEFLETVPVGRGQVGLQSFLDCFLDSMLTCGRAVGEIVPTRDNREIAALLCGDVGAIEIQEGDNPLEFCLCGRGENGGFEPFLRPDLILFSVFQPETGSPYGVSMLRSMPFLTELLLKIYQSMGMNWERMGNLRFAVTYRPGNDPGELLHLQERCDEIAREWSAAMQCSKNGEVRDFVAAGDVEIKVIGADNQILDSETPVRQILEQLIAKTGIPPFLLGLSWSSTERMSTQQADMMTSEITAIRRAMEPAVRKICHHWLRMHGFDGGVKLIWDDINLQDLTEEAKARLYDQQARAIEISNGKEDTE